MKIKFLLVAISFFIISPLQSFATDGPKVLQSNPSKIDLNQADVKTLTHSIKGIGEKKAQAIAKYRKTHDKFTSVTDLAKVPGLGEAFVSRHLEELNTIFVVR